MNLKMKNTGSLDPGPREDNRLVIQGLAEEVTRLRRFLEMQHPSELVRPHPSGDHMEMQELREEVRRLRGLVNFASSQGGNHDRTSRTTSLPAYELPSQV